MLQTRMNIQNGCEKQLILFSGRTKCPEMNKFANSPAVSTRSVSKLLKPQRLRNSNDSSESEHTRTRSLDSSRTPSTRNIVSLRRLLFSYPEEKEESECHENIMASPNRRTLGS
ncbi:hypothetical protein PV326_005750 [Microctonus aethiopoides]|nr:hypothetical protein PV326_005750 [Microctonus aethiopoides]